MKRTVKPAPKIGMFSRKVIKEAVRKVINAR